MPIKGRFNQKNNMNETELEKQILRINALEVHIKKLMAFEAQFRTYMYKVGKIEEVRGDRKKGRNLKPQTEGSEIENVEINREIYKRDKMLDEITRKLNRFEQTISNIIPSKNDRHSHLHSNEEAMIREERLQELVERLLSKKLADRINEEEKIREKIRRLEIQISQLIDRDNNPLNIYANGNESHRKNIGVMEYAPPVFAGREEYENASEEAAIQPSHSSIQRRILALEQNYLLINEVQAGLQKQMNDLIEKFNQFSQNKGGSEDFPLQHEPIFKTLYIDKLYLDKYEQNNNFAQLGIKELSGALNIGATYGKDAIPKEVTEQVKEDIAKMKAEKEEMQKQQTNTEQTEGSQDDESSSDLHSIPLDSDLPFTEITIEDDPS